LHQKVTTETQLSESATSAFSEIDLNHVEPYTCPNWQRQLHFVTISNKVNGLNGRTLIAPIAWFPRLVHATPEERRSLEIWGDDWLHWEALDEDISVTELLRMTGPSAETSASIERWLTTRS
jgi:hypothetical protein